MTDLVVHGSEWTAMKEQASILFKSGFLPISIKDEIQAIAVGIKGREIGMPMMQAFEEIDIIQQKPTLKPKGMLALIYKNCPGAIINFLVQTDQECRLQAKRPNGIFQEFKFTIEDANRMGLSGKENWKKQPGTMLMWRCVGKMARAVFPDALCGISYTPEEINPDVNITETGDVIDVHVKKEGKEKPAAFDRNNPEHLERLVKILEAKGIIDQGDQDAVIHEMQGRSSSELEACIAEMLAHAKSTLAQPKKEDPTSITKTLEDLVTKLGPKGASLDPSRPIGH